MELNCDTGEKRRITTLAEVTEKLKALGLRRAGGEFTRIQPNPEGARVVFRHARTRMTCMNISDGGDMISFPGVVY